MSIGLLCHLPVVQKFQVGSNYKAVDDMDNDSSLTEELKKETEKENESCTVGLEVDDESTKIIDKIENDVEVKEESIKLLPSNFKSPSSMSKLFLNAAYFTYNQLFLKRTSMNSMVNFLKTLEIQHFNNCNFILDDEDTEISALYNAIPEVANHFTITCKIGEGISCLDFFLS